MASLLPDKLFEARGQAPAPSKDFYQVLVTRSQVIFRWWKISLRSEFRESKPGEIKEAHEDFLDDPSLQKTILLLLSDIHRGRIQTSKHLPLEHVHSGATDGGRSCPGLV
ncbi:F-box only protein 36 isoform B [Alligator mississippiensis]|uniref:F-box only protein 36 isoform B n=1 Tax=Alligator mississippiensis TaxID=8496 RepID=A0A151NAM7_ALLMI|nr:F-box only protein 36 isoform B [Alligator mississippiensis]